MGLLAPTLTGRWWGLNQTAPVGGFVFSVASSPPNVTNCNFYCLLWLLCLSLQTPVHLRSAHQGAPHATIHAQAIPADAGSQPLTSVPPFFSVMTALSPFYQCPLFTPTILAPCPNTSFIPQIPVEHLYARLCARSWGYKGERSDTLCPQGTHSLWGIVEGGVAERPREPWPGLAGSEGRIRLPFRTNPLAGKQKAVSPCWPLSPSLPLLWLLITHLKLTPTTHLKFWAPSSASQTMAITNTSVLHTKCFSPHPKHSQASTPKSHPLCPMGIEYLT